MSLPSYHKTGTAEKGWLPYWHLMRLHRPIGWLLLLWPTLMALWGAANGCPDVHLVVVFTLGVIVMRSAGCVINDWADRHVDGHVSRTRERPLVTGAVSSRQALYLFFGLILFAFILVLSTGLNTVLLSMGALLLASCYPFMKRYTHFPQVVLGFAFAWGIPMAYCAQTGVINLPAWVLFGAMISWTVAFDTMYAMADKEDDLKIGIKSTAIGFGRLDKLATGGLQGIALILFIYWGALNHFNTLYYISCFVALLLSIYQQWLIRDRDPQLCFQAFLNNQWVGAILFLGTACQTLI